MELEEIEKKLVDNNKWNKKKELKSYKSFNITLKILSFFSIVFSLSIISELFVLGLSLPLIGVFSVFVLLIIVANEYIKVKKLTDVFSFNKNNETKILSFITVLLSVLISTYGIYKFLDRTEANQNNSIELVENNIQKIDSTYNKQIDSLNNLQMVDVEPFSTQNQIYISQIEEYNKDRENYKNVSMRYNSELRDYYKTVNKKIDKANENIVQLTVDFNNHITNEINKLNNNKQTDIDKIKSNTDEQILSMTNKNIIIISMFIFFTLLVEIGIIYMCNKIGYILKYNNDIKEENIKIEKEKLDYIKNSKEYKNYVMYKTVIQKIFTNKKVSDFMTINDFKTILSDYHLKQQEINHIISEFRTIGIIGSAVKRSGSKIEYNESDAISKLRNYYQIHFDNY